MTITAPDLTSHQERPDDGFSLLADPWTDEWSLPTKNELVAVGWPGARPDQPDDSAILELAPDPVGDEPILEPVADMPVADQLEQPARDVLTEPATYEPGPRREEPSPPIPLRPIETAPTPQIADPGVLAEPATPELDPPAEEPSPLIPLHSVAGTPQIADPDVATEPATLVPDEPGDEPSPPIAVHSVEAAPTPQIADPDLLTEPATPQSDGSPDEPESVIDFAEPKQKRSRRPKRTRQGRNRTPKWIRRHLNSRRRFRLVIATVATAYWYFAVATLAITVLVPLAAGWTTATVMSNSMGPIVSAGDVVAFSAYDGSQLEQGTIILFDDPTRENSSLMHRVVELNPDGTYKTKGDANQGSDSTHVPVASIVGMARMISPYGGLPHFWLNTGQYVWLAGWILLTAAAAMLKSPGRDPEEPFAQPVPEGETPPVRQRPIRRASTYLASEA